jgi:hypothetical protein
MRPRVLLAAASLLVLSACVSSSDPAYQWLTHMDDPSVPSPESISFSVAISVVQGDPAFLLDAMKLQKDISLLVSVRDPINPQPAAQVQVFDYATGARVLFNTRLADPGDITGDLEVRPSKHTASLRFTYGGVLYAASFSISNVVQIQRFLLFDAQLLVKRLVSVPTWKAIAPMSTARAQGAIGAIDGRLYAAGGSDGSTTLGSLEVYDPPTDTWTTRTPSPSPRFVLGSAAVGNSLYLIGGCLHLSDCSLFSNNPTNLVEAYDAAANTWAIRAPMPTPRKETAVGVIDGKIYIATGVDSGGLSAKLEVFDPAANAWTTKAPIPTPRAGATAAVVDGKLYVMGGSNTARTNILEIYDPGTNSWSAGAPMLFTRYYPASAVIDGVVHVFGGGDASGEILSSHESYSPFLNQWFGQSDPWLLQAREGLMGAAIDSRLYAVGGRLSSGAVTPTAEALGSLVDTVAPATTASQSPSSACGWIGGDATVTFTATDNAGGSDVQSIVYVSDDAATAVAGATTSFVVSAEGTSTIIYYARDKAGNVEAPNTLLVRIDRTPPTSSASLSPQPDGSQAVTIATTDPGGSGVTSITMFINGTQSVVAGNTATVSVSPGSTFEWYTTDCAGNQEARHTLVIPGDTTAPTTTASPFIGDEWAAQDLTVTLTAVDTGGSGVQSITYGSTTVAGAIASFVVTAEGINTITYFATDNAGNVEAPNTLVVRIDRTLPTSTASVTSVSGGFATVRLTAADNPGGSGIYAIFTTISELFPVKHFGATTTVTVPLGTGTNLKWFARDNAGNAETRHILDIPDDTTAPTTVAATSPPQNATGWSKSDVVVTLTATDDVGGIGVQSITYGSTTVNGATASFDVSAEGTTTIPYFATDLAGNAEAPRDLVIRIDRTPPTSTASMSPPAGGFVMVTLTADDSGGSGVTGFVFSITKNGFPQKSLTANGATVTLAVPLGETLVWRAIDVTSNIEEFHTLVIPNDTTAPTTLAATSPAANAAGWNNGTVTVTLTASDDPGGLGVQSITYGSTTTNGATATFDVSAEGTTTIPYFATDLAGNVEAPKTLVIRIDRTAPTTTASASPAPNANGWNNTPVTVSVSADDGAGSGVQSITTTPGSLVATEGVTTVTYFATDVAGNAETAKNLVVRLDMTAPVITVPASVTADATDPAGAIVNYAASAADNSGLTPAFDCAPASGSTFPIGVTPVSCTATDLAGNASAASFSVTVNGPSAQTTNLISVIDNFNLPAGTSSSLTSKLQGAIDAFASGNTTSACNMLDSFIAQAQAQSGKKLTVAQADQLIAAANQIKTAQGCL